MQFTVPQPKEIVLKTMAALAANNITSELVESAHDAKQKVLSLLPEGAEVMTMTSVTLDASGISDAVNNSGTYDSVRNKLMKMDRKTQSREMQKLGAAPQWVLGSVHAVTETGTVLVASNTGSQLPAYAYASAHVIWVVGTQKIVKNTDEGIQRITEYIVPLESERARKAYGLPPTWDTFVSKLMIVNRETTPNRIHLIFVNETIGF